MKKASVRQTVTSLGVVLLLASSVQAQTTTSSSAAGTQILYEQNLYGIGLSASLTSGMGISFKQHIARSPIAYQLTGGVFKTSSATLYDFGAEFQYDFATSSTNRVYGIAAGGAYYSGSTHNTLSGPTRFGLGVGYEIASRISPIGISFSIIITSFQPSGDILPLPSIAAHYYFR